jgi:hypothetical protein
MRDMAAHLNLALAFDRRVRSGIGKKWFCDSARNLVVTSDMVWGKSSDNASVTRDMPNFLVIYGIPKDCTSGPAATPPTFTNVLNLPPAVKTSREACILGQEHVHTGNSCIEFPTHYN